MRRFFFYTINLLLLLIVFSFIFSQKSEAATCTFIFDQSTLGSKTNSITIKSIQGQGNFAPNATYKITISGGNACYQGRCPNRTAQPDSQGNLNNIVFNLFSSLSDEKYSVGVADTRASLAVCSTTFQVGNASGTGTGGGYCSLEFTKPNPFNPKPSDYIAAKITNLQGSLFSDAGDAKYHTYIRLNNNDGRSVWDGCITKNNLTDPSGFGFGYLTTGKYYIQVHDKCGGGFLFINAENQACYGTFYVDPAGGALGGSGNPDNPIPPTPCKAEANVSGKCTIVDTALGPIGTDPQSLIKSVFGLILSISGGIALLLIIISGYKILASQGNPEALKGAREQLTAAIVGLLFIIFALVILQIIGYDILRIPGFGASTTQPSNARIGGP